MPTYEYICRSCYKDFEIIESIKEHDSNASKSCSCGGEGERVISTPPNINDSVCSFESHFNYGLGEVVTTKTQMNNVVSKIRGETGMNIQEVGTDNLSSIKKKKVGYDID